MVALSAKKLIVPDQIPLWFVIKGDKQQVNKFVPWITTLFSQLVEINSARVIGMYLNNLSNIYFTKKLGKRKLLIVVEL